MLIQIALGLERKAALLAVKNVNSAIFKNIMLAKDQRQV